MPAERFSAQLARPSGLAGRQIARAMAKANRAMVQASLDALLVEPRSRVVEIGFGHGDSLGDLVKRTEAGHVTAVDHSPLVVKAAQRRFRGHVRNGRLEVVEADVYRLPLPDRAVDRVLAVNTLTYWRDPAGALSEVARVADAGAVLVVGVRAPDVLMRLGISGDGVNVYDADDLQRLLLVAGFTIADVTPGADRTGGYLVAAATRSA